MSGHLVRIVTPSTHDAGLEMVDDYLVNERDPQAAIAIVRAALDLPKEAEAAVLPQALTGAVFNDAGVAKGSFTKLPSRSVAKGVSGDG